MLTQAKVFFREIIAKNHIKNTRKCQHLSAFDVNPFLNIYLANFLTGDGSPESIAKALVYPRVLGTSITTSFGTNFQQFCNNTLSGFASMISGIDIEFIDQIDGRKKYCQIKSGPNTINSGDVDTILNHFTSAKNIARTNGLRVDIDDFIVGVFYGNSDDLSQHYRRIQQHYPVITGQEFWHRLTGDSQFFFYLIDAIGEVANEANSVVLLEDVIATLADEIYENGFS
ncbi:MAG: PmeII family type II restriction endonuclease [Desulfitobacteriaceae bacterium]